MGPHWHAGYAERWRLLCADCEVEWLGDQGRCNIMRRTMLQQVAKGAVAHAIANAAI